MDGFKEEKVDLMDCTIKAQESIYKNDSYYSKDLPIFVVGPKLVSYLKENGVWEEER